MDDKLTRGYKLHEVVAGCRKNVGASTLVHISSGHF